MLWYFTNFSFHHKWNEAWLLVKNMVLKGCLAHCQATEVQEISKHPRIIILIKSTSINPLPPTPPPPPPTKGEPHTDPRTQCAKRTQTRRPHTPRHPDKIDSSPKPTPNTRNPGNPTAKQDGRAIKERTGILHQTLRLSGGVNTRGRIRQSKSWYSLGHSQTSKVIFSRKLLSAVSR